MTGISQNNDIARVKDHLDILDVIGDKVRLHKAGRGHVGLCPFHDEKTPSFNVSQERQNYHCFGCGKGGDVFTFVMEAEGLDFRQALELLAERAGVELSQQENKPNKQRTSGGLRDVMEIAGKAYCSFLAAPEGAAGRAYLERRSISRETASRFELGWSSNSWDTLWRLLKNSNVPAQDAVDAGLILESERGGFYDRFRGRVMFPIRDVSGRLIAFGGRIVDGEGAKYINSPESALYSKRRNLYLLHAAKNAIKERKRAILVEGYMDALRLHIHGYTETVASLGTSLTEEQAKLLKRFGNNCYICYDSDAAGQKATIEGMYILQNYGLDVYVIELPIGKDPDELLSAEGGKDFFDLAIKSARPLVLQHLYSVRKLLADPSARRGGLESLFDGLLQLQPTDITPYAPELAAEMGFTPDHFWRELESYRRSKKPDRLRAENKIEKIPAKERAAYDPLEAALCAILWRDEKCRRSHSPEPEKILPLMSDERAKDIALAIMSEAPNELETRWHMMNDRFPFEFLAYGDSFCDELNFSPEAAPWDDVCEALKRKRLEEKMNFLKMRMIRREASLEEMAEFQRVAASLKVKKAE